MTTRRRLAGIPGLFLLVAACASSNSSPDASPAVACTAAGGTVSTDMCCQGTSDFPNNCILGVCGCGNSHTVQTCDCGAGKCWDGTTCVPRG